MGDCIKLESVPVQVEAIKSEHAKQNTDFKVFQISCMLDVVLKKCH